MALSSRRRGLFGLLLIALFVLVLINVPIAVAIGVIAMVAMVAKGGIDSLFSAATTMFDGTTKFSLIAIPLFVLAIAGLGLGWLLRRKPLCGSCGNCSECIMRRAGS